MKTTIDGAGRLVIPKEIRNLARLTPGTALDVCWRDGRIEIEPASVQVRLQRRGKLLVAIPQEETQTLTTEAVEATRAALIDERAGGQ
jgi:AbrB family looped-hinge helix DNA binding protein